MKIPQQVHFRCGRVQFFNHLGNIGINYKLQPCLLEQELDHDEIYEDTGKYKEDEWIPHVKNHVLSTDFAYARYLKGMENIKSFGMKYSSSLLSLINKSFNSLRIGNEEPFYTYYDKHVRLFVRLAIKNGKCVVWIQGYYSETSEKMFDIILSELNVKNKICEIVEILLNLWKNIEKY